MLDELLHIVNETLGDSQSHTSTDNHNTDTLLADYDDLATALDDDDNTLISMVVSPDSRLPACTSALQPANDDARPLAKIIDYCPEWSFVEVTHFAASPCLTLPHLALPCLASPHLALPCLASPCLTLPCLTLPHLTLLLLLRVLSDYLLASVSLSALTLLVGRQED